MQHRSSKQKDPSEIARHVLDAIAPDAEPLEKTTPQSLLGDLEG
jgi:hypothetical protein